VGEDGEDGAHRDAVGAEGDAAHLRSAERANERKCLVDASEQQGPGVAGGAAVGRAG